MNTESIDRGIEESREARDLIDMEVLQLKEKQYCMETSILRDYYLLTGKTLQVGDEILKKLKLKLRLTDGILYLHKYKIRLINARLEELRNEAS